MLTGMLRTCPGECHWCVLVHSYCLLLIVLIVQVPQMIEELVCTLPPLGDGKVLDLLAGCGTAAVAIKKAYPR